MQKTLLVDWGFFAVEPGFLWAARGLGRQRKKGEGGVGRWGSCNFVADFVKLIVI